MKKNLRFLGAFVTLTFVLQSHAQNTSPYWSLAGNSNATTSSKLGTTNAIPLKLFTNNNLRVYISTGGTVNIGNGSASTGGYRLYVAGSNSGIYGQGSTNYGVFGQGGTYGVYGSGTTYGIYGIGTTYGVYGNSSGGYGLRGISTGNYGIYASSTNSYGGYITSTNSDGLDVYSSSGSYGVYATSGNSSGYGVFGYGGYTGVYASGGTYGSQSYGSSYGAYAYSHSGYGIYSNAYSGIGGYFHSTTGYAVEAYSDSNYYAGVFFGHVYSSQGFVTSDRRLKKNIEDFSDAMSIINKLQPKHYEFKNDAQYAPLHLPTGTHYGLIAQDLEQVLPNLVHEEKFNLPAKTEPVILKPKSADGKDENIYTQAAAPVKTESIDVKAVNYEELIPIIIKAMQEQNKIIQQQNNKIEELTQKINVLTSNTSSLNYNATATRSSNNYLMQSVPNPAKNSVNINYSNLPKGVNAQLLLYDNNGRLIKQVQLNRGSSGSVNINVSSFSAGTYSYSLLIDGKLVETRIMEIGR